MSILIKGVEMPKSCEECFARKHIEADTDHCAFDYCVFENWHQPRTPLVLTPKELKSKAPYCPLGDVPPHGRLIDADAKVGVNVTMMPGGKCKVDLIAPTIIPAEPIEEKGE